MTKTNQNMLIAVICIILSVIFLIFIIPAQIPLPQFTSGGTTPRAIPRVCCGLVIVMSLLILWRSLSVEKGKFGEMFAELTAAFKNTNEWKRLGGVMLLFAIAVCYYIGYGTVGFFITTLVVFPVFAFVLGCKKVVSIVITDLVLVFTVYYLDRKSVV